MFHLFHSRENCSINLCINRFLIKFFLNYFGPNWTKQARQSWHNFAPKMDSIMVKKNNFLKFTSCILSLKTTVTRDSKKIVFKSLVKHFSHFKLSPDLFCPNFHCYVNLSILFLKCLGQYGMLKTAPNWRV